jgi:CHAD domain-containing protein
MRRELAAAVSGGTHSVHRARVASRRLREVMPVFGGALPEAKLKKSQRRIRRMTRALGPVRELDVVLHLLDEAKDKDPDIRDAIERVRQHAAEDRDARRVRMLERVSPEKFEKTARKLDELAPTIGAADARLWRRRLAARLSRRAGRLRAAIVRAGAIYLPDRLHAVRVALKKLRYALELAGQSGHAPARSAVRVLKRGQDVLGRLHDLEVTIGQVNAARAGLGDAEPAMGPQLDALVQTLEAECRELHGRYMARRQGLLDVAVAAGRQMAPAIRELAPAMTRRHARRPLKMTMKTTRKAS